MSRMEHARGNPGLVRSVGRHDAGGAALLCVALVFLVPATSRASYIYSGTAYHDVILFGYFAGSPSGQAFFVHAYQNPQYPDGDAVCSFTKIPAAQYCTGSARYLGVNAWAGDDYVAVLDSSVDLEGDVQETLDWVLEECAGRGGVPLDDSFVGNLNSIVPSPCTRPIVYGGAGSDRIYGSQFNDILYGEGDHDVIYGLLSGAPGLSNWIYGGLGND